MPLKTLMFTGWLLAMIAVTTLALLPVEHLQMPMFDWWDKAQHTLAFAVLTAWAMLLWPRLTLRIARAMLVYGVAIEAAQWAVGWRFAEWSDLVADALGVWLAWGLLHLAKRTSVYDARG